MNSVRDPMTDVEICKKPEYLAVLGVCAHLGTNNPTFNGGKLGWLLLPLPSLSLFYNLLELNVRINVSVLASSNLFSQDSSRSGTK